MAQDYDKIESSAVVAALGALNVNVPSDTSLGYMVNVLAASTINGFFDIDDRV